MEKVMRMMGFILLLLPLVAVGQAVNYRFFQERVTIECRAPNGKVAVVKFEPTATAVRSGCFYTVYTQGNPVPRSASRYERALCETMLARYESEGSQCARKN